MAIVRAQVLGARALDARTHAPARAWPWQDPRGGHRRCPARLQRDRQLGPGATRPVRAGPAPQPPHGGGPGPARRSLATAPGTRPRPGRRRPPPPRRRRAGRHRASCGRARGRPVHPDRRIAAGGRLGGQPPLRREHSRPRRSDWARHGHRHRDVLRPDGRARPGHAGPEPASNRDHPDCASARGARPAPRDHRRRGGGAAHGRDRRAARLWRRAPPRVGASRPASDVRPGKRARRARAGRTGRPRDPARRNPGCGEHGRRLYRQDRHDHPQRASGDRTPGLPTRDGRARDRLGLAGVGRGDSGLARPCDPRARRRTRVWCLDRATVDVRPVRACHQAFGGPRRLAIRTDRGAERCPVEHRCPLLERPALIHPGRRDACRAGPAGARRGGRSAGRDRCGGPDRAG